MSLTWRLMGSLVFVALQLILQPAMVVPTGFGLAIAICALMMYDDYIIYRETRKFRREYSRL